MINEKTVTAKYIGPEHPALDVQKDYNLTVIDIPGNPNIEVTLKDGTQSINYPSKKKYLEHWEEDKDTVKIKMVNNKLKQAPKAKQVSITDAGAVIYTELVSAINRQNGRFAHIYSDEDNAYKKPFFEVKLEQQEYNDETKAATKLYGAGVLMFTITQFGLKRILWQEGISFSSKKELDNVNAYAPKLYLTLLDSLVESALLYALALTPDDADNVQALKDVEETPTTNS